jgi:hypothetical protein
MTSRKSFWLTITVSPREDLPAGLKEVSKALQRQTSPKTGMDM